MDRPLSAPTLLALARGVDPACGPYACFYCGAPCNGALSAADYVASSFTERNAVACPASPYVCAGCREALRSDLASVPLLDGTTFRSKEGGKRRPKEGASGTIQMRWFSWVLTQSAARAATPAHRDLLGAVCLSPPEPPFAICIADGNKHQLFRTPVNRQRERIAVNCEGTRVAYHPAELQNRLHLVARLVAVCGKGGSSLDRLMDSGQDMGVVLQLAREYADADQLYHHWRDVRNDPLTGLAVWLTPGKDDCRARCAAAAGTLQRGEIPAMAGTDGQSG